MDKNLTCVVAVSNEKSFRNFQKNWAEELKGHQLIILEHSAGRTFKVNDDDITHLSWVDVDTDLGQSYWIIPHNSSSFISYGCWKAVMKGSEVIVILDENAKPGSAPVIKRHLEVLSSEEEQPAWTDILNNIKPKGVPFHNRNRKTPISLNHGMWTENAVLDAATELSLNSQSPEISCNETVIPRGHYFSMSSINLAFNADVAPLMYFLLMGDEYPFEGFGDVWAGIIAKKVLDHLNLGCRSGDPLVKNYKDIDIWKSLRAESNTLPVNESLWEKIDSVVLTSDNPAICYKQIAEMISNWGHPYFQKLGKAMTLWAGLFLGEESAIKEDNSEVKTPSQLLSYLKEPPQKTIRPKLPSESESLLDFLHTKALIPDNNVRVKENGEDEQVETKVKNPKKKETTVQTKTLSETTEDELIKVSSLEDNVPQKNATQALTKKENVKNLKNYTQAFNKEDIKPFVANPKKLLIKEKSNGAFIPRKKP